LTLGLWDAVSDVEHAIEAHGSDAEGLDIYYEHRSTRGDTAPDRLRTPRPRE
jgi:hypothetical protein